MRSVIFILCLLSLVSCQAGKQQPPAENRRADIQPVGLELESEISGLVLGAPLANPSGLAVSRNDEFYVADTDNHRIIKFGIDRTPVRDYGSYGLGIGRFHRPMDLYLDRGLNLYVADSRNHRVVRLDANLGFIEEIPVEEEPDAIIPNEGALSGIVISQLGEITVADYDNSRLVRMDNFNRFSRYIGDFGYGAGSLLEPLDIDIDYREFLYVADAGNGRITIYDDLGNYIDDVESDSLERPTTIALEETGSLWVFDKPSRKLLVLNAAGDVQLSISHSQSDPAAFGEITALAMAPRNRLFVADGANDRILIYKIIYAGK